MLQPYAGIGYQLGTYKCGEGEHYLLELLLLGKKDMQKTRK